MSESEQLISDEVEVLTALAESILDELTKIAETLHEME